MVVEIDSLCLPTAALPPEDHPPMIVDADRVEARQVAAQLLEMIAWRRQQVLIGSYIVDHLELAENPAFKIGRDMPRLPILDQEGTQPLVPKAHDHAAAQPPRVYAPLLGTKCNRWNSYCGGWRSDDWLTMTFEEVSGGTEVTLVF